MSCTTRTTALSVLAAAALALSSGAGAAGTEPDDDAGHDGHDDAGYVAAGEPASAEATAFCDAGHAADQAFMSDDPEAIGAAIDAVTEAAPDELADAVETLIATEGQGPEGAAAEAAINEYRLANCGYAQLQLTASEYSFGGLPAEVPAGTTMIGLANTGEQLHDLFIFRVDDDVDLTLDELLELPDEEFDEIATMVGIAFAFPGETGYGVFELEPGRHVAGCGIPDGLTPDAVMALEEAGVFGPDDTFPDDLDIELGPPHFVLGMVHEFVVE